MTVATQSVARVPVFGASFTEPGFNQDPYPLLARIRDMGPVVYNDAIDRYMVTGYRDCATVLGTNRLFDMHRSADRLRALFGGNTMETVDQVRQHNAIRAIWAPEFQPDGVARHAAMIADVADARIGPFVERIRAGETVEAVTGMTRAIPTLVIARLLDVDPDMFELFAAWSDAMGAQLEATLDQNERTLALIAAGREATRQLNIYLADLVRQRRGSNREDLVSRLVNASHDATGMSEQDMIASVTQLVFAGNETTAGMMAATLVTLAEFPEQRAAVAAAPALGAQAFEEVHRWHTLSQGGSARFACSTESQIAGIPIPPGAEVMALLGIANRDPERWAEPDRFDIMRERRSHLGFGFGMHSCLGLNLARLEVQIWLQRFLAALPEYHLAAAPDYGTNFLARRPVSVLVAA